MIGYEPQHTLDDILVAGHRVLPRGSSRRLGTPREPARILETPCERAPAAVCARRCACCWRRADGAADVQLTHRTTGRSSLVAKDATVRQILAEWARVGQTRIVNGERIAGGPVTLELTNVPEAAGARHPAALGQRLHGRAARAVVAERVAVRSHPRDADRARRRARRRRAAPPPPPRRSRSRTHRAAAARRRRRQSAAGAGQLPPALAPIFNTFPQPQRRRAAAASGRRRTPGDSGSAAARRRRSAARRRRSAAAGRRAAGARRSARRAPGMIVPPPPAGSSRAPPAVQQRLSRRRRLMPLVDEVSAAIADAMRQQDAVAPERAAHAQGGVDEREVEKGTALDDAEARQVVSALVKQRQGLDRAVHERRPPGSRRQGSRRDRRPRSLPAAGRRSRGRRARRRRGDRRDRRDVAKDMGRVMKAAMARLAGQNVDGKIVNELGRKTRKLDGADPTVQPPPAR